MWIFAEQMNSLSTGADIQLKTILMHRHTERPCSPFQTAMREREDAQVSGQPGIVIHQDNLKLKFSTYLESILPPLLYKSQVSSLMQKVLCTLALPFLCFDLRYCRLHLVVLLLQSNLLKRSKQNTRSQIHRMVQLHWLQQHYTWDRSSSHCFH